MYYLAYDDVGRTVAVVILAISSVILVWNFVRAIHDWRVMARKPTSDRLEEQDSKIDKQDSKIEDHERRITILEECCDDVHGKLDADRAWQQASAEKDELMLKSIKQLLKHSIDNDDVNGLKEMESEIDSYLIKHQSR